MEALLSSQALTVSLWFRQSKNEQASMQTLFAVDGFAVMLTDGTLAAQNIDNPESFLQKFYYRYNDDQFHHLVLTRTMLDGVLYNMFIDGERIGAGAEAGFVSSSPRIYIGSQPGETDLTANMTGIIDDVRVFSAELPLGLIQELGGHGSCSPVCGHSQVCPQGGSTCEPLHFFDSTRYYFPIEDWRANVFDLDGETMEFKFTNGSDTFYGEGFYSLEIDRGFQTDSDGFETTPHLNTTVEIDLNQIIISPSTTPTSGSFYFSGVTIDKVLSVRIDRFSLPFNTDGCSGSPCSVNSAGCFDQPPPDVKGDFNFREFTCGACDANYTAEGNLCVLCPQDCGAINRHECSSDSTPACESCAENFLQNDALSPNGFLESASEDSDACLNVIDFSSITAASVFSTGSGHENGPVSKGNDIRLFASDEGGSSWGLFVIQVPNNVRTFTEPLTHVRVVLTFPVVSEPSQGEIIGFELSDSEASLSFTSVQDLASTLSFSSLVATSSGPNSHEIDGTKFDCANVNDFFSLVRVECNIAYDRIKDKSVLNFLVATNCSSCSFSLSSGLVSVEPYFLDVPQSEQSLLTGPTVGFQRVPQDCILSDYQDVGQCSVTCGGGTVSQTKVVLQPASSDGQCETITPRTVECNTDFCPDDLLVLDAFLRMRGIFLFNNTDETAREEFADTVLSYLKDNTEFPEKVIECVVLGIVDSAEELLETNRRRSEVTRTIDIAYEVKIHKDVVTETIQNLNFTDIFVETFQWSYVTALQQFAAQERSDCFCPAEQEGSLLWVGTECGQTAKVTCPDGENSIRRFCSTPSPGFFQASNAEDCVDPALQALAETEVTETNVKTVVKEVETISQKPEVLGKADVSNTIVVLVAVLDTNSDEVYEAETTAEVIAIASNLLDVPEEILDAGTAAFATTKQRNESVPELLETLAANFVARQSLNSNFTTAKANIVFTAITFEQPQDVSWPGVNEVNLGTLSCSGDSCQDDTQDSTISTSNVSITIPSDVVTGVLRVHFIYYQNARAFNSRTYEAEPEVNATGSAVETANFIDSPVVSGAVEGVATGTPLTTPVRIVLPILYPELPGSRLCGFFVFLQQNTTSGDWSTVNCVVSSETTDTVLVCLCSHMTNFAVLTSADGTTAPSSTDQLALQTISIVGICISVPCLVLCIFLYAYFKAARTDPKKILMNLSATLAIALIIFVAGADETGDETGCQVVAILLHYFLLSAFAWMLVEGYHLHETFVNPLDAHSKGSPMPKYYAFAYFVPAIVVAVCAGAWPDDYGTDDYCWLSTTGNRLIWAFLVPVIVVASLNMVMFFRIFNVIQKMPVSFGSVDASAKTERRAKAVRGLKASVSFFSLMGITWLFGILALGDASIVFQYIFAISNTLQGLFIFIFHCLMDPVLKNEIRKKLRPSGSSSDPSSSSQSGTGMRRARGAAPRYKANTSTSTGTNQTLVSQTDRLDSINLDEDHLNGNINDEDAIAVNMTQIASQDSTHTIERLEKRMQGVEEDPGQKLQDEEDVMFQKDQPFFASEFHEEDENDEAKPSALLDSRKSSIDKEGGEYISTTGT
eukprot:m.209296 g.209296  ORF g.209296 m.209296 type:complete len:1563 (-) comp26099_c1_seq1:290-4978(-)